MIKKNTIPEIILSNSALSSNYQKFLHQQSNSIQSTIKDQLKQKNLIKQRKIDIQSHALLDYQINQNQQNKKVDAVYQVDVQNDQDVVFPTKQKGYKPAFRQGPAMVYSSFTNKVYLLGGLSCYNNLSKKYPFQIYQYTIQTNTWKQIQTGIVTPQQRFGHIAITYKQFIFIYGGAYKYCISNKKREHFSDIWVLDLNTYLWQNIMPEYQLIGRRYASCCRIGKTLLIHGGITREQKFIKEIASINLQKRNRWVFHQISGLNAYAHHKMIYCKAHDKRQKQQQIFYKKQKIAIEGLYIIGGIMQNGNYNNKITIIKISYWGDFMQLVIISSLKLDAHNNHRLIFSCQQVENHLFIFSSSNEVNPSKKEDQKLKKYLSLNVLNLQKMIWMNYLGGFVEWDGIFKIESVLMQSTNGILIFGGIHCRSFYIPFNKILSLIKKLKIQKNIYSLKSVK